jgi:hypothetical protein
MVYTILCSLKNSNWYSNSRYFIHSMCKMLTKKTPKTQNVDIQFSGQAAYAQSQIWNPNHLKVLKFLDQVTQMA